MLVHNKHCHRSPFTNICQNESFMPGKIFRLRINVNLNEPSHTNNECSEIEGFLAVKLASQHEDVPDTRNISPSFLNDVLRKRKGFLLRR